MDEEHFELHFGQKEGIKLTVTYNTFHAALWRGRWNGLHYRDEWMIIRQSDGKAIAQSRAWESDEKFGVWQKGYLKISEG